MTIDELINDICESITGDLETVLGLWDKMGLSVLQLKERRDTVIIQVSNVTNNMVKEEIRNEAKVMKLCNNHLVNITAVWAELQCKGSFSMEDDLKSLSLLDREKYLREQLDLLHGEKVRRMEEGKCLRKEESDLSSLLGVNHLKVVENILLTDHQRAEIKNHIVELKKIKKERENRFLKMKEEIASLMEKLEIDINTASQTNSIMLDESGSLRMDNLRTVQETLDKLKKKLKESQKDAKLLIQEILALYDKLKVPSIQRLPLAMGQVVSIEDLYKAQYRSQLQVEMINLKKEKQKHIVVLVENAMVELNELWERCFVSKEDRAEISKNTMESTNDTLEKIDHEISKLTIYYNSNRELFFKYKKLISLWQSVEDLDIKSRNPNRLLQSRGNSLFKEEKERRQVAKLLPKIEQELTMLAEEKMVESGLVLSIGRVPLINVIKNLRIRHSQQLKNISTDLQVATKSMNGTIFNNNKQRCFQEKLLKRQTLTIGSLVRKVSSPMRYKSSSSGRNLRRPATNGEHSTALPNFGMPKSKVDLDMIKDFEFGNPEASSTIIGSNSIHKSNNIVTEREGDLNARSNSSLNSKESTVSSDEDDGASARQFSEKRKFGFNFKKVRLGEHCAAGRNVLKFNSVVSYASRRRLADPTATRLIKGDPAGAAGQIKRLKRNRFSLNVNVTDAVRQ